MKVSGIQLQLRHFKTSDFVIESTVSNENILARSKALLFYHVDLSILNNWLGNTINLICKSCKETMQGFSKVYKV